MDTFSIERIKSIVEYRLKQYRINSLEYKNDFSTSDPSGIKGLILNDKQLSSWDQKPKKRSIGFGKDKYTLYETNYQLRDFLSQIIIDVLCDTESNGKFSKANEKIYNIIPSSGDAKSNKTTPFIIKKGDVEFKIDETGVYINNNEVKTKSNFLKLLLRSLHEHQRRIHKFYKYQLFRFKKRFIKFYNKPI